MSGLLDLKNELDFLWKKKLIFSYNKTVYKMKNNSRYSKFLGLMILLTSFSALQASEFVSVNLQSFNNPQEIVDNVDGVWKYTVENAPPEYSTGLISIFNENDEYGVEVQLAGGALKGSNVSVEGNKVSFDLSIEGTMVTVKLVADGDTISGSSSSSQGSYSIQGNRVKPQ
ncbi:hypothetical protein B0O79_0855 [Flavobacteriaceae bacterium MAR_2009_75]|nr:hypothetical protein B0O79_0855 [Flavobacteriaceae bacterium MAR_2009_75]